MPSIKDFKFKMESPNAGVSTPAGQTLTTAQKQAQNPLYNPLYDVGTLEYKDNLLKVSNPESRKQQPVEYAPSVFYAPDMPQQAGGGNAVTNVPAKLFGQQFGNYFGMPSVAFSPFSTQSMTGYQPSPTDQGYPFPSYLALLGIGNKLLT